MKFESNGKFHFSPKSVRLLFIDELNVFSPRSFGVVGFEELASSPPFGKLTTTPTVNNAYISQSPVPGLSSWTGVLAELGPAVSDDLLRLRKPGEAQSMV